MVTPVVMVILQGLSLHYNGYRQRLLSTQGGDISLAITKLRQGSFFPDCLKPRRRDDKALYAVVMEAPSAASSPARLMPWLMPAESPNRR